MRDSSCYLKIDQLSHPDKFFPWLKKIARNRSKDFLRRKKDTIPLVHSMPTTQEITHDFSLAQANPDIMVIKQELIDAIMEAIESLPVKDREVIRARMKGLNHSEISEQLDISISASMNRLYRARKKLAAHIKNLLYGIINLPETLPRLCRDVPSFKKIVSGRIEAVKVGTFKEVTIGILSATQSLTLSAVFHIALFIALSFSLPLNFPSDSQKVDSYLEIAVIPTGEQQPI